MNILPFKTRAKIASLELDRAVKLYCPDWQEKFTDCPIFVSIDKFGKFDIFIK